MQNCLALQNEIPKILELNTFNDLEVILSDDSYNPIAAVTLFGFVPPHCITPSDFDVRIPIPNLYGFTESVTTALVNSKLYYTSSDEESHILPSCHRLDEQTIRKQQKNFVDLKEQHNWPSDLHFIFLTPFWNPKGFIHTPLLEFIERFWEFLQNPYEFLNQDIQYCQSRWLQTKNPWWLKRTAQIQMELGNIEETRSILLEAIKIFPARKEFSQLLETWAPDQ